MRLDAGEKEIEGLVSRADSPGVGGRKGREIIRPDTHNNFTPAAGGLSVTVDAQVSDNGKTRDGPTPN